MRFSVKVPVLSVRMTVVAPSVSTADRRSISAFRRAMRHMPRPSASVATIGRPSGMAATASAIAASTMRKGSLPVVMPATAISAVRIRIAQMSWPDSRDSRFSSGDLPGSASSTSPEIRPSAVCRPVATATPRPLPAVITVPLNSIEVRSATRASAATGVVALSTAADSPVSVELVGGEVGCFDQSHVRRDRIAAFDEHDVARHQLLSGNHAGVSTSAHARRSSAESLQRLDGARGLDLGQKADQAIEPENGCDRGRLLAFAEVERQRRRGG